MDLLFQSVDDMDTSIYKNLSYIMDVHLGGASPF